MKNKSYFEEELSDPERMQKKPDLADIFAMADGGIERQEKRGQEAFVNTESLPKDLRGVSRQQLESIGFKFFEDIDDIFVRASLPEGWKKVPTDHSMWSKLVDEKGRERASIFYKAAFYDRSASLNLSRRFAYGTRPVGGWDAPRPYRKEGYVTDCDKDIFVTSPTEIQPEFDRDNRAPYDAWRDTEEACEEEAKTWLAERYPDWRNEFAYWD